MSNQQYKPIWYFVGLILITMGAIIVVTGIYFIVNPQKLNVMLAETHPNLWWGSFMIVFGLIMYLKTKDGDNGEL